MQQQIKIESEPDGMTGSQAFAFVLQRAIDASADLVAANTKVDEHKQHVDRLQKLLDRLAQKTEDLAIENRGRIEGLSAQRDALLARLQKCQAGDQPLTDLYKTAERAMMLLKNNKPFRFAQRVDVIKDLKLALAAAEPHVDLIPF